MPNQKPWQNHITNHPSKTSNTSRSLHRWTLWFVFSTLIIFSVFSIKLGQYYLDTLSQFRDQIGIDTFDRFMVFIPIELLIPLIICGAVALVIYKRNHLFNTRYSISRQFLYISSFVVILSLVIPISSRNVEQLAQSPHRKSAAARVNKKLNKEGRYYGEWESASLIDETSGAYLATTEFFGEKSDFLMYNPAVIPNKGDQIWVEYSVNGEQKVVEDMGVME